MLKYLAKWLDFICLDLEIVEFKGDLRLNN